MTTPEFAFEKKISIPDCLYGDYQGVNRAFNLLFQCMKDTNKIHGVECEFFRFDFRQPYFDEIMIFARGGLICHFQWGSKEELEDRIKSRESNDVPTK